MGTEDSKIWRPTSVHFPADLRLTPLAVRELTSSRLVVLRVLVRMNTGLGTSFASKNSIAYIKKNQSTRREETKGEYLGNRKHFQEFASQV